MVYERLQKLKFTVLTQTIIGMMKRLNKDLFTDEGMEGFLYTLYELA